MSRWFHTPEQKQFQRIIANDLQNAKSDADVWKIIITSGKSCIDRMFQKNYHLVVQGVSEKLSFRCTGGFRKTII